jgi:hypothetical protein
MANQPEKLSDGKEKSKRSRVGFLVGMIWLPILYMPSPPWVAVLANRLYPHARPRWVDDALSSDSYPVSLICKNSETFRSIHDDYAAFVITNFD